MTMQCWLYLSVVCNFAVRALIRCGKVPHTRPRARTSLARPLDARRTPIDPSGCVGICQILDDLTASLCA
eukprot:5555841-Prymnesium_polylepis.1